METQGNTVQALKAHLAINVKDVERSIEFYQKLFGIEPSKVRTGYAKFNVENPPLNFTLNQAPFGERGALSHLGIQVASTDDVLAIRQKWADAGLSTRDEMQTDCCYAMQDKTWVRDPDGNEWEAFVVLKDNLAETAPCECGDKVMESKGAAETPGAACATSAHTQTAQTASCCGAAMPVVEAAACCEVTPSSLVQPSR
jgi:catechol 2,3-dioxygenase-like lactoylglutathione lyase family enzyme